MWKLFDRWLGFVRCAKQFIFLANVRTTSPKHEQNIEESQASKRQNHQGTGRQQQGVTDTTKLPTCRSMGCGKVRKGLLCLMWSCLLVLKVWNLMRNPSPLYSIRHRSAASCRDSLCWEPLSWSLLPCLKPDIFVWGPCGRHASIGVLLSMVHSCK